MNALRVTTLTHRGAVRAGNEDALVVGPFVASEVEAADPAVVVLDVRESAVVAIADGLGGHAAGEVAAAHAARRLAVAGPRLHDPTVLDDTLVAISGEIEDLGRGTRGHAGLGTTVAGIVVGAGHGLWFNAGDSRVYQLNSGYLAQLSVDDSPAAAVADDLRATAALTSRVTNYLGRPGPSGRIVPHVGELVEVREGTRWLLCSDGLSDLVDVDAIERILERERDECRAVRALFVAAMNAGGHDNVTIALATLIE